MGVIKNDVGRPSNKTLKIRMILRLIVVLIAVALIVGVGYFISDKKNKEKDNGWYEPTGTAKTLNIYGQNTNSSLSLNSDKEDFDFTAEEYDISLIGSYKCTYSDCMMNFQQSGDYETVIIKDKDYIVYNFKTNKAKKMDLGDSFDDFDYYYFDASYTEYGNGISISSTVYNDKTYYEILSFDPMEKLYMVLIDSDLKPIFCNENDDNYGFVNFLDKDNEILYYTEFDDNYYYYKYNVDTKKTTKSKRYKSVEKISEGHILVVDNDDYLKLLDSDGKVKAEFVKLTDDMSIEVSHSDWYSVDNKYGFYVTVSDPSVKLSDLSEELQVEGHSELGYMYYYIPSTNEIGKIASTIGQ